jgi:hypothetical protein
MVYHNLPVMVGKANSRKEAPNEGAPYWLDCKQVSISHAPKKEVVKRRTSKFNPENNHCNYDEFKDKVIDYTTEGVADCDIKLSFFAATNSDYLIEKDKNRNFKLYSEETTATLINENQGETLNDLAKFQENAESQSLGYFKNGNWPTDGFDGNTCIIYPFKLPDFGDNPAPFNNVFLKFYLELVSDPGCVFPSVSLGVIGVRDSNEVLKESDYRWNTFYQQEGTLVQDDILTKETVQGQTITSNDLSGVLNSAYNSGANINKYVFFRLYVDDSSPQIRHVTRGYEISSVCKEDVNKRPRIEYSYQTLGRKTLDDAYGFLFDDWLDYEGQKGNGNGSNFFPITIGDMVFNNCYLKNYSFNVAPFTPVSITASFKCYEPPVNQRLSVYSSSSLFYEEKLKSRDFIYGHYCGFKNLDGEVLDNDRAMQVTYTKVYKGDPVLTIDSKFPTNYIVDETVAEMSIDATGFNFFLPNDGLTTEKDITINLKNSNGESIGVDSDIYYCRNKENPDGLQLKVSKGSLVSKQDVNINGGDSLYTKISVKDTLL